MSNSKPAFIMAKIYSCLIYRHLLYLEKLLKYNNGGSGYFVGDKVWYIVLLLYISLIKNINLIFFYRAFKYHNYYQYRNIFFYYFDTIVDLC